MFERLISLLQLLFYNVHKKTELFEEKRDTYYSCITTLILMQIFETSGAASLPSNVDQTAVIKKNGKEICGMYFYIHHFFRLSRKLCTFLT